MPKRFRSLCRSPGFFGRGAGGGPPKPPAGAGGCMAWYSSAGISIWRVTTLVRPKRPAPAAFPLASRSSGAAERGKTGAAKKIAQETKEGAIGRGPLTHGVVHKMMRRRADRATAVAPAAVRPRSRRSPLSRRCDPLPRVARRSRDSFWFLSTGAGRPPRVALRSERHGEGAQRAADRLAGHLAPASRLLRAEHGQDAVPSPACRRHRGPCPMRISRIWPKRASSSIAPDPLALRRSEPERLHDLRLPEGGRPLRLEGDLAEPDALRGRQDRVDLRLVGAGLLQGEPHALGRRGRMRRVAEGLDPAPAGAGGEVGHLGPLALVEPQVVERGGLGEQIELPGGAENRQVGEDRLDPPRGVAQLGLRVGVAPALLDELLVVGKRRASSRLRSPSMPGRWASSSSLTWISSSTARRARRNRASASSAADARGGTPIRPSAARPASSPARGGRGPC